MMDTKNLDALIKSLKGELPKVKVGILGDSRNATIGAAHEFGTSKLPRRSFLRVPIADHFEKYMESSGIFTRESLEKVIEDRSMIPWLTRMGILAEKIVAEAFSTGGFGKWAKWKNPNYENNTGQILIDTQQLRNSITSEVT